MVIHAIFTCQIIGPKGILKGKTRLLVTHGITYLPNVDHIVVLKDGKVSEEGTYKELLQKKGAFADFLVQHIGEEHDEDVSNVVMELEQVLGGRDKILARQQSQLSDDGSGEVSLRKRTISVRSHDSGNTPSPGKKMSLTMSPKKEELPQQKNKLIEVEKAETGSVKGDVYMHYFRSIGIPMLIATLVSSLVSQGLQIGGNYWLGKWSEVKPNDDGTIDPAVRNKYLLIYAALGAGQCKLFVEHS